MQGRSFETSDKVYKYIFSSDGRSVDYYKNGSKQETWTFYGTEDGNNAKAAYTGDGLIFKHWGFNLRGADDLYCTTGQGSTIYETLNMRTWADPAYPLREQGAMFSDSVKGLSFGLRKKDSEGLLGLDVVWYRFDSTGGNVTEVRETYHGDAVSTSYQVSSTGPTSASFGGKNATLKTDGAHWTLTVNGDEYVAHYQDPGPSFLNRVRGKTYSKGVTRYVFSGDGKTLTLTYEVDYWVTKETKTKEYSYDHDGDEGVSGDYIYAQYGGYYLDMTGNDSTIRMATVDWALRYQDAVMEYEAHLVF